MSAVRWATNRGEAAKMNNFYRMQRQFSDLLNSNDMKTGDLARRMQLFNVKNIIGHVQYVGRTLYVVLVVLSELIVSIRL